MLWLIVGIGVNIANAPDDVRFPATALNMAIDATVLPDTVMTDLAAGFDHWLTIWRTEGFSPVREAWLERAARINMEIQVRLPHETLKVVFRGLDQTGALRLGLSNGEERVIAAGDVFFDT